MRRGEYAYANVIEIVCGEMGSALFDRGFSLNDGALKDEEVGGLGQCHGDAQVLPLTAGLCDDLATDEAGAQVVPVAPEPWRVGDIALKCGGFDVPVVAGLGRC